MRLLGFGIFVIGLTVASWYAAYVPEGTGAERIGNWASFAGLPFGLGFAAMLLGVALARYSKKREDPAAASEGASSGDAPSALEQIEIIAGQLDELVAEELNAQQVSVDAEALAGRIDAILSEDVPVFLDAREKIIERYGLETFAELIGHFAVMERATARAWSAITDQAYEEVPPSLTKAKDAIHRTLEVARSAAGR